MTVRGALALIRKHGIVLESAQGAVPSLAAAIAREPLRGSWWSHAKSHEIFRITRAVRDSEEVLVCRLVGAKITFVHRRLWPALVGTASRFSVEGLAQVKETHSASGRHLATTTPFPKWVPSAVFTEARKLTEDEAVRELEEGIPSSLPLRDPTAGRRRRVS